jgi:hypothetical protein
METCVSTMYPSRLHNSKLYAIQTHLFGQESKSLDVLLSNPQTCSLQRHLQMLGFNFKDQLFNNFFYNRMPYLNSAFSFERL